MDILGVLACFYTVVLSRKLPLLRQFAQRGVKPISCDVCMSAWTALGWATAGLAWSGFDMPLADYLGWAERVAACAGGTFLLLSLYAWAKMLVGWKDPDELRASDYAPPPG